MFWALCSQLLILSFGLLVCAKCAPVAWFQFIVLYGFIYTTAAAVIFNVNMAT